MRPWTYNFIMSMDQFQILERLDYRNFAIVLKVRRKSDNEIYAMKRVKLGDLGEKEKKKVLKEVRIMASLQHQNILAFKEAFFDEDNCLCIITEFAEGRDILTKIKENKKFRTTFTEDEIWDYLIQMLRGLNYLQSNNILHQEIGSANILLSRGVAKLGYIYVSTISHHRLGVAHCETPYYACPELWQFKPYTSISDVWSVGCVVYEMAALRPPFMDKSVKLHIEKVINCPFPPIPTGYSTDLSTIISLMLQVNPVKRPNSSKLLKLDLVRRHDREHLTSPGIPGLPNSLQIVPPMREITKKLPNTNIDKNIKDRRSITHITEEKTKAIEKQRGGTDSRVVLKVPQITVGLPVLSPRQALSGKYSDSRRDGNLGNIDKKALRQNVGIEEFKQIRPLVQAGTDALNEEALSHKSVTSKVKIGRVSSEPYLNRLR